MFFLWVICGCNEGKSRDCRNNFFVSTYPGISSDNIANCCFSSFLPGLLGSYDDETVLQRLRVYIFLLALSIKFILNLKTDSCYLKNIWLDPVYSKEHCGLYLLFQGRIFGKILKKLLLKYHRIIFFILKNHTV